MNIRNSGSATIAGFARFAVTAFTLMTPGCSDEGDTACTPGRTVHCACPGGMTGVQECASDSTFGECACGPGGGSGTMNGSGSGEVGPGRSCSSDADCLEGLLCAQGGMHAGLCTMECEGSSECLTRFGETTTCDLGYCTTECVHSDECGENGTCFVFTDVCRGGKAELGETCSADEQCEPGLSCATEPSVSGSCTAACSVDADGDTYYFGSICAASGYCSKSCYIGADESAFENDDCVEGWLCLTPFDSYDGYCSR